MRSLFVLEGVLRTVSPLHVTDPVEARVSAKTGRLSSSPTDIPLQRTVQMSFGGEYPLPIIPPNGLRGRLRRMAAAAVSEVLAGRGEQLPLDAYQVMRCGAPHGSPDSELPSIDEYQSASGNVFLGLFGGGPRMISGRLCVDMPVPITPDTIAGGYVPERYDTAILRGASGDEGRGPRFTRIYFHNRQDDVQRFVDTDSASGLVKDWAEEVDAWQAMVGRSAEEAEVASQDEDASVPDRKKVTSLLRGVRSFSAKEVVLPGMPFYFRLEMAGTEAQAGLMLEAVRRLHKVRLGGGGRIGFGKIHLDLTLAFEGESVQPYRIVGDEVEFATEAPLVGRLVEAMEAELEAFNRDAFVSFATARNDALTKARAALAAKAG